MKEIMFIHCTPNLIYCTAESNTTLLSNMCTYSRCHLKEVLNEAEVIYTNRTENRGCMGKESLGKCTKYIL